MSKQIGCDNDSFVRVATVTVVTVRCTLIRGQVPGWADESIHVSYLKLDRLFFFLLCLQRQTKCLTET